MKALAVIVVACSALLPALAHADDSVSSPPVSVAIGQQFPFLVSIETAAGAEVEINTESESWGSVEVVRIDALDTETLPSGLVRHTFTLTLAAFAPGELAFSPEAFVIAQGIFTVRQMQPVSLVVQSPLPPGSPLELSPISSPGAVDGAESPLLLPGIAAGGFAALLFVAFFLSLLVRWWQRRPREVPAPLTFPEVGPALAGIEGQLADDPVTAYRVMATSVRASLADQYGFPARALTTHELQLRMEAEGVDRWQSRLVRGLLDECDQVIYAGYRPAMERRTADLDIARELLEGSA